MNRSTQLKNIIESVMHHVADVHPDHAAELSKRLKKRKIKHTKTKKVSHLIGYPYVWGFSCAPEHIGGFNSCCHDVANDSNSSNPVCVSGGNVAAPTGSAGPAIGGSNP